MHRASIILPATFQFRHCTKVQRPDMHETSVAHAATGGWASHIAARPAPWSSQGHVRSGDVELCSMPRTNQGMNGNAMNVGYMSPPYNGARTPGQRPYRVAKANANQHPPDLE